MENLIKGIIEAALMQINRDYRKLKCPISADMALQQLFYYQKHGEFSNPQVCAAVSDGLNRRKVK